MNILIATLLFCKTSKKHPSKGISKPHTIYQYASTLILLFIINSLTFVHASNNIYPDISPNTLRLIHLMTDEGISVGTVEAIIQDKHGMMWFGGKKGLVRYDGYNFKLYKHSHIDHSSLSSNVVWDLLIDRYDQIWVATENGLNRFNDYSDNFTRFMHNPDNPNSISHNNLRALIEDSDGTLWIGTFGGGLTSYNRQTNTFHRFDALPQQVKKNHNFSHDQANGVTVNKLDSFFIKSLHEDSKGRLWIGTQGSGLYVYTPSDNSLMHYTPDSSNTSSLSHSVINEIQEDHKGVIWIGTQEGLNYFEDSTKRFVRLLHHADNQQSIGSNRIDAIFEDRENNLWVGTDGGGLNLFDQNAKTFQRFQHSSFNNDGLTSNVIRTLFEDREGNLWIGNFPNGASYFDRNNTAFTTFTHNPTDPKSLSHKSVMAFHEDKAGNLWIGTDGGGLNHYNRLNNIFTRYKHDPKNSNSLSANAVLAIEEDSQGNLWIGTWGGGLNKFDPKNNRFTAYQPQAGNSASINNLNIWSILEDSHGTLWIATQGGGLNRYNREKDNFDHFTHNPNSATSISSDVIWTLYEDSQGELWVGTQEGLNKFNRQTETFSHHRHTQGDNASLSHNRVMAIFEDDTHNLWIGTRGGLNYWDRKTQHFTVYRESNGLASDVIQGILQGSQGELWLSTNNGLSRFDPQSKTVRNYDSSNWLPGNHFNIGAFMKSQDGKLYFGSTKGFTAFSPNTIQENKNIPPVLITDIKIFNKPVSINKNNSPLRKPIVETSSITLNHTHSVFSLTFSSLDYRAPQKNQYAYQLVGFDKDWNHIGNNRSATYTNLDPGDYLFRVKATNSEGLWNEDGQTLAITILPPPWRTWWAYSIYGLLVITFVLAFIRAQQRKVIEEQAANRLLEQKVIERTQELETKNQELLAIGKQLEELSLSDPLTGLKNRRFLLKTIPSDVANILRQHNLKQPIEKQNSTINDELIIFLLDIDHFKSINDTHGHHAGDQILKQLASLLEDICRQSDYLIRWGGEEFLIAGRFSNRNEAPLKAERIRSAIAKHTFLLDNQQTLQVSCSIGFACFPLVRTKPDLLNWEQVVNIADQALYKAKAAGRNCWIGIDENFRPDIDVLSATDFENIDNLLCSGRLSLISQQSIEAFDQQA